MGKRNSRCMNSLCVDFFFLWKVQFKIFCQTCQFVGTVLQAFIFHFCSYYLFASEKYVQSHLCMKVLRLLKTPNWEFLEGQVVRTLFSLLRVQVQFLVKKLKFLQGSCHSSPTLKKTKQSLKKTLTKADR